MYLFCVNRCKDCDKCFTDGVHLRNHMDRYNRLFFLIFFDVYFLMSVCRHATEEEKVFMCKICEKKFFKRHMLTKHMRTHTIDEAKKEKNIKTANALDRDNELVQRFFQMECSICTLPLTNFVNAKQHYQDVHAMTGYLLCCDKKYFKFYRILQHCAWHLDSTAFR